MKSKENIKGPAIDNKELILALEELEKEKGIKNVIKNIWRKENYNFEDLSNESNKERAELYKYIYDISKGDAKLIGMRYELLYAEYTKRTKINLPKLAKNRNIKTIQMAEELDKNNNSRHIKKLIDLAKEIFN